MNDDKDDEVCKMNALVIGEEKFGPKPKGLKVPRPDNSPKRNARAQNAI